ncbi:hypothetical protein Ahy_B10g101791 [Arachis hypogaea]|uniref:Protein FAR1-RELATED SEQUENCE n=1 Tax=Arachis hypogaea TaxID=3818 RepID=A0A444X0D5_ARAHY|nr:hypothetical protein Ahy_B10g101791 [Arachis hypogaea]
MFVRRTIKTHEEARIRPSKTYQSFVAAADSHRELGFIEKDVRNYITTEVRNIFEEDDAKEFGKYLVRMKEKNQNFFFELNLEGDQCIKHAFWADARSMDAFISETWFYLTPPITQTGSFVGVNHHSQSTLLGCALMKNEDIQSFKWLFKCWLHCMGGKAPKCILIDQYASIQRAIEINWIDFLRKYGLGGNKWLLELYEDRHIWIPVYLDHHFWAGMRSTQMSESMHSFFNKFITRKSSLRQFIKQYDNCLASREQAEREFNAAKFYTVIPCATKSAIEAQF